MRSAVEQVLPSASCSSFCCPLMRKPTLPEDRRALADRLNRLQEAIQQLRSNLS